MRSGRCEAHNELVLLWWASLLVSLYTWLHFVLSVSVSVSLGGLGPDLGPPPSVDEAANSLMTRLGFLLGDKVSEGSPGLQYSMDDDAQVSYSSSPPDINTHLLKTLREAQSHLLQYYKLQHINKSEAWLGHFFVVEYLIYCYVIFMTIKHIL